MIWQKSLKKSLPICFAMVEGVNPEREGRRRRRFGIGRSDAIVKNVVAYVGAELRADRFTQHFLQNLIDQLPSAEGKRTY